MNTRVMALSKAEDDSHLPTLLTRHYIQRDLLEEQKRPTRGAKETY